jgi:hypothetical protein
VVEGTLSISRGDDYFSIVGEVLNESENTAVGIQLQIAGLDADGQLVETATAQIYGGSHVQAGYYGPGEVIPPGETGFFTSFLGFRDSQVVETILIRASGYQAEIEIEDPSLVMTGDWEVETEFGWVTLIGVILNTADEDIVGLNIRLGLRNSTGTMLALVRNNPRADRIGGYLGGLRSGEETEVTIHLSMDPEEFASISVETRLAGRWYEEGHHQYGVAGVAHAPGANGSVWCSSLGLTNQSGAEADVRLTYWHAGGGATVELELDDGETFHREDVVRSLFDVNGQSAGYVQITASVPLMVSGRTTNESPAGGFGQSLPVYTRRETLDFSLGQTGVLSTLGGGERFRSNLGLVNMADADCSARVQLFKSNGAPLRDYGWIQLGPTEWRQLNRAVPSTAEVAYAIIEAEHGCPIWAYGSVIEEATGDPTTVVLKPWVEIDLAPRSLPGWVSLHPWADHASPEPPPP